MRKRRGQSILEYVIILVAIVAAIAAGVSIFAKQDESGTTGLSKLYKQAQTTIETETGKLPK